MSGHMRPAVLRFCTAVFALALFVPALGAQTLAPGEEGKIYLRLAEVHPADHPTARGDAEFARRVAELSKGRINIEVYYDGVLGDEPAVLEQLTFGGIDIARVSIASVQPYMQRLSALFMPYLYRDAEHMWRVLASPVGQQLLDDLKGGGLVGIGWFEAGARSFYTSTKPVRRVEDLSGLRIRVQESPPMVSLVQALGAKADPLVFSVVYSRLRTKALDGAENNLATYYVSGHYQEARYFTFDEHARLPEIIVGSPVAFAGIGKADQELIRKAASDAVVFQRAAWSAYEAGIREKLTAAGVTFYTPQDLPAWEQRARTIWSQQSPEVKELLSRIRAIP